MTEDSKDAENKECPKAVPSEPKETESPSKSEEKKQPVSAQTTLDYRYKNQKQADESSSRPGQLSESRTAAKGEDGENNLPVPKDKEEKTGGKEDSGKQYMEDLTGKVIAEANVPTKEQREELEENERIANTSKPGAKKAPVSPVKPTKEESSSDDEAISLTTADGDGWYSEDEEEETAKEREDCIAETNLRRKERMDRREKRAAARIKRKEERKFALYQKELKENKRKKDRPLQ